MRRAAYIAVGANLGSPLRQVESACVALAGLPETELVGVSSWYWSAPIGPEGQPEYLNGVVALHSGLPSMVLLSHLHRIEQEHGRQRRTRWAARTLDLDLLLVGGEVSDLPGLKLPHPEMRVRNFVMVPLAELAPDLRLPDGGCVSEVAAALGRAGLRRS